MREFFKAYKKYIVKHPRRSEYKPTNLNKYDERKLLEVCEKVEAETKTPCFDEDVQAISDFVEISSYVHGLYEEMYNLLYENYRHLNLNGCDIAEYIIAFLNREYKVILDKSLRTVIQAEKGSFFLSDLLNFKLQSTAPEIGLIQARAALETETDTGSLLLNFLRFFLDKDLSSEDFKPEEFAGRIRNSMEISQMAYVLKTTYDDILCNDGFVKIDYENKLITFNYENHYNLKLLKAGDMMFSERRASIEKHAFNDGFASKLFNYVSNYRIREATIKNGCISFDFEQGDPVEQKIIVGEIQSAIRAFYEFLDGDTILPILSNCTINEAIAIWCSIQYMAKHVLFYENFDKTLYRREDFSSIPCKIVKSDLISYVQTLTGILPMKIQAVITALEADWNIYNDIWTSMLYPVGKYYLLPFFSIINSAPYNVIDQLLLRGGFNLDDRGAQFEMYLFTQLTQKATAYPIVCLPTGKYGEKGNDEEIDVLISMKNVVLVADAKCIHYSIDPLNYAEAWERLEEGCVQAARKAKFVKNNPQYFSALGDYSSKAFIPFVITNYPTYTGFSYNGVYVIDSHSFLAYMQGNSMIIERPTLTEGPIVEIKEFYQNEDQFSNEFAKYLLDNPIKKELIKRIYIHEGLLVPGTDPWRFVGTSAQVSNDPRFNISNNVK